MKTVSRFAILLLLVKFSPAMAQSCDGPVVGFDEVMSSLSAGVADPMSALFAAAKGESVRGYVHPETNTGWTCENDWTVVFLYFGAGTGARTDREALDKVDSLDYGGTGGEYPRFARFIIEVDGVEVDTVRAAAQLGQLPFAPQFAGAAAPTFAILPPLSLSPGTHTATAIFEYHPDACIDLGAPSCTPQATVNFEVLKGGDKDKPKKK